MNKCLILVNEFKKDAHGFSMEIRDFLESKSYSCEIFSYDGNYCVGNNVDCNFKGYDFVVTLGGDGTVLYACRNCAPLGIPVFPINLGEFGFLAEVSKESWKKDLEVYLSGKAPVSKRNLVECEVIRGGVTVYTQIAMNDAVVSALGTARIINLNVAYNHSVLGPFKSSGLIVSTATGSTAYSAAEGGPIMDPSLDGLLLTPISSFSLSARPLVFGNGEISITVMPSRSETVLITDGQNNFNLQENDVIILKNAQCKAKIICSTQEKFFMALQSKLNWSGGPRA